MPIENSRESLKRRRESYQLSLHHYGEVKRHRCSRTEVTQYPSAAASYSTETYASNCTSSTQHDAYSHLALNACAAPASATDPGAAAVQTSSGVVDNFPRDDASSNALVLRLRSIRVEVVRGDTGRRISFYLDSTFFYTWYRGNHFYRSLEGEQVGLEVSETVYCQVSAASPHPHIHASSSTLRPPPLTPHTEMSREDSHRRTLLQNEEVLAATSAAGSVHAAAPTPSPAFLLSSPHVSYTYEATQVSRRLTPPTAPDAQSTDVVAHLGSCSPALFLDGLLKCVHDEAGLPDDQGWVYLYHGRHVLTDGGRGRLLHDLFTHAYFPPASSDERPCATLTLCVFRKH